MPKNRKKLRNKKIYNRRPTREERKLIESKAEFIAALPGLIRKFVYYVFTAFCAYLGITAVSIFLTVKNVSSLVSVNWDWNLILNLDSGSLLIFDIAIFIVVFIVALLLFLISINTNMKSKKRLLNRITKLEEQLDPKRTSSNIPEKGGSHPEDE